MKETIKKDAKRLLLALVLGVFGFVGGFISAMICTADNWFDSFGQCITTSAQFGLICAGIFAGITLIFPSTVKSLIRFFRKEVNKDE